MSSPAHKPSMEKKNSLSPDITPQVPVKTPTDETTSFPLAAQVPVTSFTLPTFPPEASHLRELTLTSDIPLPEYQPLVTTGAQYELPQLPQSVTHLTFELFSLGFPGRNPHFLTDIARALPNLKSITFFSCLIDGLSDHSREDAEQFFSPALTPQLREIHIIDSFVRPTFWSAIIKPWAQRATEVATSEHNQPGIKVIEVSYTFRGHEDFDFLARLHGEELPLLIQANSGIVGAGFGLVEVRPEEIPDVASPGAEIEDAEGNKLIDSKKKEVASGILPFASDSRATSALKAHFAGMKRGELGSLKVLNLSMWTLTVSDLRAIFDKISVSSDDGHGDKSVSARAEEKAPAPASATASEGQEGQEGTGLIDFTVSLLLTDNWHTELVDLFSSSAAVKSLVAIEIVGVPAKPVTEGEDWRTGGAGGAGMLDDGQKDKVEKLGEACPTLVKLEMTILKARKAGAVLWVRGGEGGAWELKAY